MDSWCHHGLESAGEAADDNNSTIRAGGPTRQGGARKKNVLASVCFIKPYYHIICRYVQALPVPAYHATHEVWGPHQTRFLARLINAVAELSLPPALPTCCLIP